MLAIIMLAVFIYYKAQHEPQQVVEPVITYPEIERPAFEEPIQPYLIMNNSSIFWETQLPP